MSTADETLDNIKRENRLNPDDKVTFLLSEIKYRDDNNHGYTLSEIEDIQNENYDLNKEKDSLKDELELTLEFVKNNIVNYPEWIENLFSAHKVN